MPGVPEAQDLIKNEPQETKWFVMCPERNQLGEFLKENGLDQATTKELATRAEPTSDGRGWIVSPSAEQVLGLDKETRARLYQALGKWKECLRCRSPFRIADHAYADWRAMMNMDPETSKRFDRLSYRLGNLTTFADLQLILPVLKDQPEAQNRFVRGMLSEFTYLAHLRVKPDDSIDRLVKYWGAGGREGRVRPLIEAAATAGGEISIPLSLLLPDFPRRTLYTYPASNDTRFLDCHYSSINFFNGEADPQMLPGLYRDTFFNAFYEVIDTPMRLGDVVVLIGPNGEVVHSATLVAGELFFTKNGGQRHLPWMLMTLDDVQEYFSTEGPLTLKYYRRKVVEGE